MKTGYQAECVTCGTGYGVTPENPRGEWFATWDEAGTVPLHHGWKLEVTVNGLVCPACQKPDPLALPEPSCWWASWSSFAGPEHRRVEAVPVYEAALRHAYNTIHTWSSPADYNRAEVLCMLRKALVAGGQEP
jgi:hypothetical protein